MKTTEDEPAATPRSPTFRFPVGYHQLHDDPFLNFEMNRPFGHVRSLTAQLFTEAEQAQNHCQAGNIGLALRVIVDWLDLILTREPH